MTHTSVLLIVCTCARCVARTARFTAAASLDPHAPRHLQCAAVSASPSDLVRIVSEATGEQYKLHRIGTV
jgi:hypothetical protein